MSHKPIRSSLVSPWGVPLQESIKIALCCRELDIIYVRISNYSHELQNLILALSFIYFMTRDTALIDFDLFVEARSAITAPS